MADLTEEVCPVTFESFTAAGPNQPVFLPARGHTFSRIAVQNILYVRHSRSIDAVVRCPLCATVQPRTLLIDNLVRFFQIVPVVSFEVLVGSLLVLFLAAIRILLGMLGHHPTRHNLGNLPQTPECCSSQDWHIFYFCMWAYLFLGCLACLAGHCQRFNALVGQLTCTRMTN